MCFAAASKCQSRVTRTYGAVHTDHWRNQWQSGWWEVFQTCSSRGRSRCLMRPFLSPSSVLSSRDVIQLYIFTQYQTRCKSPSNLQWCIIMLKASCLLPSLPVFLGIWSNCFLVLQLETKLFHLICWTWNTLIVSYWLSMHMVCHLGHSKLTSCFFPVTLFQEGHLS